MSDKSFSLLNPDSQRLPTGVVQAWAQFNVISKVFTGIFQRTKDTPEDEGLNTTNFLYSPIDIDMGIQEIVGNYDNFQIVLIAEQPQVIHEAALDGQMRNKINEEYSNNARLEILERAVLLIGERVGVDLPELADVVSLVNEIKRTNALRKQSLEKDPEYRYVSAAEAAQIEMDQLEGGLHEVIGPRRTTYGVAT